ncbi:uncharacterized protein LOC114274677 [Camellia sinensis]|uniref:uncharacterized protein LOC114274677 n=1 Tax=Camellia sinensis TaxID=4442 RepID=UPI0010356341|nr:uncharacterized protein LOC114274677 [Camellia sinensis]
MVGPPDTRRRDKRCEYHKDHGHDTDNCYALKDHLEELAQDGRLQQHVQKNAIKTVAIRQDSPPLGIIHMIYGLPTPLATHAIQSAPQKQRTPSKQPHEAPSIVFDDSDLIGVTLPHSDPLVIELHVSRSIVEHVLIDQGSTSEVMYYETFIKLDFNESDLSPVPHPLFGFNANLEYPLGKISLPVRAGSQTIDVEFLVIKLSSPYNLIMGRTWLHAIQDVPSTYHQLLHFPTVHGIEQIHGSRQSTQTCYLLSGKTPAKSQANSSKVPNRNILNDVGQLHSEKPQ